jgi:hypothetical protein
MALQNSSTTNRLERVGMPALSAEEGLGFLVQSMKMRNPVLVAVVFKWNIFFGKFGSKLKVFSDWQSLDAKNAAEPLVLKERPVLRKKVDLSVLMIEVRVDV